MAEPEREPEQEDLQPVRGVLVTALLAKVLPWLIRVGAFLGLGLLTAAYGWWVWRQTKKLEAAGVEPLPAPTPPAPGPLPPARPPRW